MTSVSISQATDLWTIQRVLEWSTNFLKEKKFPTARLDAELLLSHALGLTRIQLYTGFDKPLSPGEREPFKALLKRRVQGEPIAYITGYKEFMGHTFAVTQDVLIPRPDTEVLVEAALAQAKKRAQPLRVLDIGTGSGCIAISLALALPDAEVEAWDVCERALGMAQRNAQALGATKVRFLRQDGLEKSSWQQPASEGAQSPCFDLIVTNPPYIAFSERAELANSVKDFEPELALFAEDDGLLFYRVFAAYASRLLKPDGLLLAEIGYQQAEAVREIFGHFGWRNIAILKDYGKNDRVVAAYPPESLAKEADELL